MFPALFSWFWAVLTLWIAVIAWKRLKGRILKAALCLGLALNVLAGLANGLVITVNGRKMPVEPVSDEEWAKAPRLLCDSGDGDGLVCTALSLPLVVLDWFRPDDIHHDVTPGEDPWFAWLDDRHPLRFCERSEIYSLGDAFAAIGWMILAPTLLLWGAFGLVRRLRKRKDAPS